MRLRIITVFSCLILAVGAVSIADESTDDPIQAKLAAAQSTYEKDIAKFNEEFERTMDIKIAAARKSGKEEIVDHLKAELEAYKKEGAIPTATPVQIRRKRTVIRGKLEEGYATAIKSYTKIGNDAKRKTLEEELKTFQRPEKVVTIKAALVGTWKVKIRDWNTSLVFHDDGTVLQTTERITSKYTIDPDKGTITCMGGGTILKLPLDPNGTTANDANGDEFVIVKQK